MAKQKFGGFKNNNYLGQQEIWLEQNSLKSILSNIATRCPINVNIFKTDPSCTAYSCHNPIKIQIKIYKCKQ